MSEQKMVNLKINDMDVTVPAGTTVLEAARSMGIKIPTLCYLKDINVIGACRICVVEVKRARSLVTSCCYPVNEGMEVYTNTERVINDRRTTLELLLSDHNKSCLSCERSGSCELQTLCNEYGVDMNRFNGRAMNSFDIDASAEWLVRDDNKCILCNRCVAVCHEQGIDAIGRINRGFTTHIGCEFDEDLKNVGCIACGQCINVCPTGALHERENIDDVIEAIADPNKHVVMATAPSVRVGIGEEFGYPIGENHEGQMVAAMKRIGVDDVFDVNFTADLTIMEEATEFLGRVNNGGVLPMFTSCCPAWIRYVEYYEPDLIPNLSSCKSPQQMFGAVIKTYYAEKNNIDPKDICMVSVMPCTAKKFEVGRPEQMDNGVMDVDITITTRELAKLIKRKSIDFRSLKDEEFDNPFGVYSGAGLIFGNTGGVMEAALRTAVETLTGEELKNLEFADVRGLEGIKEATYNINGLDVKVAVCNGVANAKNLIEKIKSGEKEYHFVEVMSCPGGCINGGGQPIVDGDTRNTVDWKALRAKAIYDSDLNMKLRKSHENPYIKKLYEDYFGEPNSHKAHEILHTTYVKREY